MQPRNLRRALAEASKTFPEEMHPAAQKRVLERLASERRHRRGWAWLSVPLAAATCAAVALLWMPQTGRPLNADSGLAITGTAPHAVVAKAPDGTVAVATGNATVEDEDTGSTLVVSAPAALRKEAGGVRVLSGRATIAVRKRPPNAGTAKIFVSGGTIEVLGTRFTVMEQERQGRVELHEGSIRFTYTTGQVQLLEPGESLRWPFQAEQARAVAPLEPPAAPQPDKATETPAPNPIVPRARVRAIEALTPQAPSPVPAAVNVPQLLQHIGTLRLRGDIATAVRELEAALESTARPATRERLSYELGTLYTYSLSDTPRACAHWRRHEREYPQGLYEQEVRELVEKLRCSNAP